MSFQLPFFTLFSAVQTEHHVEVEVQARSVELSGMRQVLKAQVEEAEAESEAAQAQLQLVSHHQ